MSDVVIRAKNIGKQYALGDGQRWCPSVQTHMRNAIASYRDTEETPASETENKVIWALNKVSFDVRRGEVLGIIGRNGSGKSTLLKILSRITPPTTGWAELVGRVGSLLEVGTGFHPDLTGRDNIYMNGAVLGMTTREIDKQFGAIVTFAEIETFLDTPVKRYSSGMHMRLAFAVAAHLKADILLVDEVLAVGDAAFQQKCLSKMDDVSREGRTVLLVSHNIASILNLCSTALLLDHGEVLAYGGVRNVVDHYLSGSISVHGETLLHSQHEGPPRQELSLEAIRIRDSHGRVTGSIDAIRGCTVEVDYAVHREIRGGQISLELWNGEGVCVLCTTDLDYCPESKSTARLPGLYRVSCRLEPTWFRAGRYWISLGASIPGLRTLDEASHAISFEVVDTGSIEHKLAQGRRGIIAPTIKWSATSLSTVST
ncbi:MAG: ABC transporter ATP-binding protein [Nitrospira sp.]|nr:ABC transporter ATP-binding protein [Nitrospira sp.]